jgi:hypothetical protein
MLPYWIAFLIAATGALTERSRLPTVDVPRQRPRGLNGTWWLVAVGLALFIGLRHEVGGDWYTYLENYQSLDWGAFWDHQRLGSILARDPAYRMFEWLSQEVGFGIYGVNLLAALVFAYGLARFCRALPMPWLALTAALPYLVTVVAMGYTRQAVAIGCAMVAFTWLIQGNRMRFVIWIALGSLFHQTALILIPLAILATTKRWFVALLSSIGLGALGFALAFQEPIARLSHGYLAASYESEGAMIRLAMNALPALLFLMRKQHFAMNPTEKRLWSWFAWASISLLALLSLSPSSTAVDRIGLYLIPIQLAIAAHWPAAYQRLLGQRAAVFLTLVYSTSVLATWLLFANHAFAWLPYQSVLTAHF